MTKRSKFFQSPFFLTAKAIALAVMPLVLIFLPKTFFDKGQSLCLFTLLTGDSCYGCGMTRACMHIIHLDFSGAANFNKISFIVFPIICGLYLQHFIQTVKQLPADHLHFLKKNA